MDCWKGNGQVWLGALLALGLAANASAAELLRGPYLQSTTPEGTIVRWRTDVPTESMVFYGTTLGNLNQTAGDLQEVTEHEVRLSGLSAATQYYYAIGSMGETLAEGPEYHFFTHPAPGTSRPTRVWIIGDPGTAATGSGDQIGVRDAYYQYAGTRYTDVWLALGDNAYNNGTDQEYQVAFFNIYPTLLRQTALWSTIGNHETYSGGAGGRFPYLDIFTFPTNGQAGGLASGTERYYSFDYANIHFVCLDSMTSARTTNGAMADWLRRDLADNTSDWIIAFFHHPPYSKGSHDSDRESELIEMRRNLMPILEAYGADLVLSGHSHIYERSYLLRGHFGSSTSLSPTNLLDRGSGRPAETGAYFKPTQGPGANQGTVYAVAGSSGWATFRTGHHPVMFADLLEMGSLVLDINSNRLDAVFLRETGAIDDSFTIIKGNPPPLQFSTFVVQNGQLLARWQSLGGQRYQVERASSLNSGDWQPVSSVLVASGSVTSWTNTIPADAPRSYYRVVNLVP